MAGLSSMTKSRWIATAAVAVFAAARLRGAFRPAPALSVQAVIEKHKLLGIFAADCAQPPSDDNLYYVTRLVNAGLAQRDIMNGAASRAGTTLIDKASELNANEVRLDGAYKVGEK